MGMDVRVSVGYGFRVDEAKLESVYGDDVWEAIWRSVEPSNGLLTYVSGSGYDDDPSFAVVVERTMCRIEPLYGYGGLAVSDGFVDVTEAEGTALKAAYDLVGEGDFQVITAVRCS